MVFVLCGISFWSIAVIPTANEWEASNCIPLWPEEHPLSTCADLCLQRLRDKNMIEEAEQENAPDER